MLARREDPFVLDPPVVRAPVCLGILEDLWRDLWQFWRFDLWLVRDCNGFPALADERQVPR
jgi:hypothetical protein